MDPLYSTILYLRCVTNLFIKASYLPTTAGKDVGLGRMDSNAADVVRVGFKHMDALQGVVVEHANLHVILGEGSLKGKGYLTNKQWMMKTF